MKKPEEILNSEEKLEAANRNIETDSWGEYNQQEKRWVVSPVSGGIIRLFIQRLYGLVQKLNRLYSSINVDNYDTEEGVLVETYKTITIPQDGGNITVNVKAYEKVTNVYQISFNTNGGNEIQPVNVITNQEYILPTPTFGDWTFDGWYNSEGEKVTSINQSELEPVIVTAKWKTNITLTDSNGDRVVEVNRNEEYNLPAAAKKQGYNGQYFDIDSEGWFRGNIQILDGLIISEPNIKLVAKYPEICEVNFTTNMDNLTLNPWYVVKGTTITLPTLTSSNYIFKKWIESTDFSLLINSNTTVHAYWQYSITLVLGEHIENNIFYYDKGESFTIPGEAELEGVQDYFSEYTLTNWLGNNGITYQFNSIYSGGNIILTLQKTPKIAITFNVNGATNTESQVVYFDANDVITIPSEYNTIQRSYTISWNANYQGASSIPNTYYNYTAAGWYSGNEQLISGTTRATQNKEYTIRWEKPLNGLTIPNNITRTNYELVGWTSNGINITQNTTPTSNVTYDANWLRIVYTITWNFNYNGSSTVTEVLAGNNAAPPTASREGYTCIGWNTSSTATTGLSSLKPTSNTIYYAIWTLNVANLLIMYSFETAQTSNFTSGSLHTIRKGEYITLEENENNEDDNIMMCKYHYIPTTVSIEVLRPTLMYPKPSGEVIGFYDTNNGVYKIEDIDLYQQEIKYI